MGNSAGSYSHRLDRNSNADGAHGTFFTYRIWNGRFVADIAGLAASAIYKTASGKQIHRVNTSFTGLPKNYGCGLFDCSANLFHPFIKPIAFS